MEVNYANIVDFLIGGFSEFKATEIFKEFDNEDLKLPYIIWGAFVTYVIDRLQKNGEDDPVLKKLFNFINNQFDDPSSDPDVLNLLSVTVFEGFAQVKESLEFSRKNTRNKARHAVEMILTYTGVDKPDFTIAPEAEEIMQSIRDWNDWQSKK